ncbi:MAG: serine/threonine-protein kinase [Oscillatoriales cyanobacterium]|nr:tetratricopeptide repeat protein [Microcoleus sp. PH2017_05_CCC_O_A]MCC3518738.1 tetratricopeptide repeat protein [Microcoleus sp. PH2017_18_LLB_O_A]TAG03296.1 MAG: serine/threonine-protein kinase [Oscillatoriales cyanobacterium]TAG13869.1 MAG: serine/threonine-protein kinase [Oscillatoriales cyanobacterium]TAG41782.1 MAG: serine/threonine-protein kinase [Oscillatoriales cyanobacterium]
MSLAKMKNQEQKRKQQKSPITNYPLPTPPSQLPIRNYQLPITNYHFSNSDMNMVGQLLDRRYRVVQILSSGAFGQTYLAVDTRRPGHPQCVVKQLRPPSNTSTVLKTAYRLFKQEAEILEKLGKHDQIPFLLAYFEESNQFYLVEEFVPGHALNREIVAGQPWREERVLDLLEEVLKVLAFVHSQGVIHRDVNPSNLIRRKPDGKLVLIDFGSVKEVANHASEYDTEFPRTIATGTPAYMPIEQFQGNPQFSSDLYAVGMMAIQAITGLPGTDLPKLQDPSPSHTGEIVWRNRAQCSQALANIIDKMVCHQFSKRYPSAEEVLAALSKLKHRQEPGNTAQNKNISPSSLLSSNTFSSGLGSRFWWLIFAGCGAIAMVFLFNYCSRPNPIKAKEYYEKGVAKSRNQDAAAALQAFDKSIQLNPNNGESFYQRGNANYDLKKYQEAIADYSQTIALNPQYFKAYFNRGLARRDFNDKRGAIEDYTQVLKLQPNDVDAYYERGVTYLEMQDYKTAIGDLTEVIRLQPNLVKAYHSRGLARAGSSDLQGAIGDYTEAIKLDAQNVDALYSRGRARFHLGDYQGALADYSQVIAIDPKSGDAYANRCSTQLNLGAHQAAIDDCTQAISLSDEDGVPYNNRCIAYLNLKDYPKAIADCTQATTLNPKDYNAFSNRGLARSAGGDTQGAIADFTAAIGLNPNDAEAYANRAKVYQQLNNSNSAIADYVQAIRINPNYAGAYYGRGMVRRSLGDKAGAISDFEKAGKIFLDQGLTGGYKDAQFEIDKLK